jgi:hypothetical protein
MFVASHAVSLMNVPKDVDFGLDPLDHLQQILTTYPLSLDGLISVAERWSMGDQDICIFGYEIPLGSDLRTALEVECPIEEPRLPGAAIEKDPLDGHSLIL